MCTHRQQVEPPLGNSKASSSESLNLLHSNIYNRSVLVDVDIEEQMQSRCLQTPVVATPYCEISKCAINLTSMTLPKEVAMASWYICGISWPGWMCIRIYVHFRFKALECKSFMLIEFVYFAVPHELFGSLKVCIWKNSKDEACSTYSPRPESEHSSQDEILSCTPGALFQGSRYGVVRKSRRRVYAENHSICSYVWYERIE